MDTNDDRSDERNAMVQDQILARGIRDARVLDAMRSVPRHRFIDPSTEAAERAYADGAQPIAAGQRISQPYIVALMTESLQLTGGERVLEIGAGSGYQSAILSTLARELIAIERHAELAEQAWRALQATKYAANITMLVADGSCGWPSRAPYDAILCAAVAPTVPSPLVNQLAPGGRLVLPVGPENGDQRLLVLTKLADGSTTTRDLGAVAFVPLVGAQGFGLPEDVGDGDV
jgi:protein-L-isoaspartate(D-aspartate) O-methyltransferase